MTRLSKMVCLMSAILTFYHPALVSAYENVNECVADETTAFRLDLMTDNIPQETTWDIKNLDNNDLLHECGPYNATTEEHTLFNYTFCLDSDGCYRWTIRDLYGGFNEWFKLYWNGELIREGGFFNMYTSTTFGNCPTFAPSSSPTSVPSTLPPTSKPTVSPPTVQIVADTTNDQSDEGSVDNDESSGGKSNVGAIVGGTVGGVFFLGLLALLYVKLFRTQTNDIARKKRRAARRQKQKPPLEISATF